MLKLKGKKESQFLFKPLSAPELKETTRMMTTTFLKNNSIWVKLAITYEDAFDYNAYRLQKGLEGEITFIYIESQHNQMVGVMIAYDLYDYLHEIRHYSKVPASLAKLKKHSSQLEDEYLQQFKNIKRGEHSYGEAGAVHPSIIGSGEAIRLFVMKLVNIKMLGFKTYVGRTTHKATSTMLERFGAKLIKSVKLHEEDIPSLDEQIDLYQLDFRDFTIKSMSDLQKYIKN